MGTNVTLIFIPLKTVPLQDPPKSALSQRKPAINNVISFIRIQFVHTAVIFKDNNCCFYGEAFLFITNLHFPGSNMEHQLIRGVISKATKELVATVQKIFKIDLIELIKPEDFLVFLVVSGNKYLWV